ncbi:hypothetical protein GPECTOR_20g571 [Gonium pectorale]|uniref:Uncharacterized protein n=1 Tax=Gonium pectorale TaxID=33097 RepID=A0A150GIW1_GONPE|nr:hypothetical protein GPECTOR_20g571 [Gonium pectorale]|eukprot:KXZ49714.1 hypothetical protein GPECTOR_20g571 [Gonium pectorale]
MQNGWSPLMTAAYWGHVPVLRELLKWGADKEERGENGWTPLMRAAYLGRLEAVRALLEVGADWRAIDKRGWTDACVARGGWMAGAIIAR